MELLRRPQLLQAELLSLVLLLLLLPSPTGHTPAAAAVPLSGLAAVTATASCCHSGWCWLSEVAAHPDGSQLCTKRHPPLVGQHIAPPVLELVGEATHCYA
jgi:hypothetical protein